MPRFSLIVPAYNESALLPRLFASVAAAKARYAGGGAIETVVADNASTDDTAEIARQAGCVVASVTRRCIASARNGGAAVATGEVLCFVDADCIVHPETFNVIAASLGPRLVAGTTGVVPERWTLGLRATYCGIMLLLWPLGIDAGVVFCRREDFEAVGGYNEDRLFAEDVEFLLALRSLGRRRHSRQRLSRLRGAQTVTSTRKFDKHGDWHMLRHSLQYLATRPFSKRWSESFARHYWYDDR